jgi:hypothetical protein
MRGFDDYVNMDDIMRVDESWRDKGDCSLLGYCYGSGRCQDMGPDVEST